ncbi:MAG: hypothetical protein D6744_12080 [Planctomycetota bacterium]|nr:MAG: hypothetical protein D6744_12080 [Planctomycetota bacterium]
MPPPRPVQPQRDEQGVNRRGAPAPVRRREHGILLTLGALSTAPAQAMQTTANRLQSGGRTQEDAPAKPRDTTMAEPRIEDVTIRPEQLEGLRWELVFGRTAPVEIEIGTGKAGYLLRRARAHPEIDFLGIEWANKFYRYAADRMRRWGVTNVRMLRTDADHFIKVVCPRASVQILHIYHPDPWPKKRHHKRRLLQSPFVDAATACLVDGGQIRVHSA